MRVIEREGLDALIDRLSDGGWTVVGPTVRGDAIEYGEIGSSADLPEGWTDEQDGGTYRLRRRGDRALFGYAVGPHSWKRLLYPPETRLWSASRTEDGGFEIEADRAPTQRHALVGVRPCELHAIQVQDRVLMGGSHADPGYRSRREAAFVVVVNCGEPSGTCFCASMDTGPAARAGYDLALTEIVGDGASRFTAVAGSERGQALLSELPGRPAAPEDEAAARRVVERARGRMGRDLRTEGLPDLLRESLEHPRWEEVASRCLTCGNCTLVCPTCFCTSIEDLTSLDGLTAERRRRWDSCFVTDFSHIHGGSVRASASSRYRQWLVHKLGTWHEQFGTSGCVGCGRCITWCPVAIDLTEEVAALRRPPPSAPLAGGRRPGNVTPGGEP